MMWVRPSYRTYAYNLNVGEQYYSPLADYVKKEDIGRQNPPGPLTFSERLHYKWSTDKFQACSPQSTTRREHRSSQDCKSETVNKTRISEEISTETERAGERRGSGTLSGSCHAQLVSDHLESLDQGRRSRSGAVRRAEQHARVSGQDPRHVTLPRGIGADDVSKKVADLRLTPISGRDYDSHRALTLRGRARILRLEKELDSVVSRSLAGGRRYFAKSARQLAKEAEKESQQSLSGKYRKMTTVESKSGGNHH